MTGSHGAMWTVPPGWLQMHGAARDFELIKALKATEDSVQAPGNRLALLIFNDPHPLQGRPHSGKRRSVRIILWRRLESRAKNG